MEEKKKSINFHTRTIYFPPLKKEVNILLQKHDGPCLLIAIFNSLVIKGKVSIKSGIYSSSSIINIIQDYNPEVHELEKVVNGYYVNPSFNSCTDFIDYPEFLNKLGIRLMHSMIPSKWQMKYSVIKNCNYDSLVNQIVELDSSKHCSSLLRALKSWYSKISKQITQAGVKQIEKEIQEGEALIYFRKSHFACIYKYSNHVYSLLTFRGHWSKNCVWSSLPSANEERQYFDMNFEMTYCKSWEESRKSSQRKTD